LWYTEKDGSNLEFEIAANYAVCEAGVIAIFTPIMQQDTRQLLKLHPALR